MTNHDEFKRQVENEMVAMGRELDRKMGFAQADELAALRADLSASQKRIAVLNKELTDAWRVIALLLIAQGGSHVFNGKDIIEFDDATELVRTENPQTGDMILSVVPPKSSRFAARD